MYVFVYVLCVEDVEVKYDGAHSWIENVVYGTQPILVHGNGGAKVCLANYDLA